MTAKQKMRFVELSRQLVGQTYELGRVDCFSIILQYLDLRSVKYAETHHGLTRQGYPDLYRRDRTAAKKLMISFMDEHLERLPLHLAFCGDVVLLQLGEEFPFLAIEAGNGNIIGAAPGRGVGVTPRKFYRALLAWRVKGGN